jgi:hypothetical protein
MVKVSISLPNNTQITFESEESEVLHEVVGMVLRDLPRDLMQTPTAGTPSSDNGNPANTPAEKSSGAAGSSLSSAPAITQEPAASPPVGPPTMAPVAAPAANFESPSQTPAQTPEPSESSQSSAVGIPPEFLSEEGRRDFVAFCQSANPLGDMRRVVVAAEGAGRHFGVDGVNADDLGWLFDLAGWRKPGNFTQTLRNAARSKFCWLERIPGRSGRYAATPLGLSKTLPSS